MTFERSIKASVPKPAANRTWLAAALLEAPDQDGHPGPWSAIEAVPGGTDQDGKPTGIVPDTISTRHAQHNPGWYRIQWYDDGQNSKYSKPVRLADGEDSGTAGRWN